MTSPCGRVTVRTTFSRIVCSLDKLSPDLRAKAKRQTTMAAEDTAQLDKHVPEDSKCI